MASSTFYDVTFCKLNQHCSDKQCWENQQRNPIKNVRSS